MQTGALRQLDIKVKQCMYKCVPGYKIKHLCEKQGASLLLALCIRAIFVCMVAKIIIISNIIITNIYFQCLVDAHASNPEARELV